MTSNTHRDMNDAPHLKRLYTDSRNYEAQHPYPLMWEGGDRYRTLPTESLTLDMIDTAFIAPYCVIVRFFATSDRLLVPRDTADAGLTGRGILPGDLLIFDAVRAAPQNGAVVLVQDGAGWVARVCAVLADGTVEYHADTAAEGYPILTGERRVSGTLAAVIRATDGRVTA